MATETTNAEEKKAWTAARKRQAAAFAQAYAAGVLAAASPSTPRRMALDYLLSWMEYTKSRVEYRNRQEDDPDTDKKTWVRTSGWKESIDSRLEILIERARKVMNADEEVVTPPDDGALRTELLAELEAVDAQFAGGLTFATKDENGDAGLTASVVLGPISLEDGAGNCEDFGRFRVSLHAGSKGGSPWFDAEALSPNAAANDEDVVHPHVSDGNICLGDGANACGQALQQGRVLDAFLLVKGVLENYGEDSPYVPLSEWRNRKHCSDCGSSLGEEDGTYCHARHCELDLCDNCGFRCASCEDYFCDNHSTTCSGCEQTVCTRCLGDCERCNEDRCADCLEDGKCASCNAEEEEEAQKEEEGEDEDPPATSIDASATGTAAGAVSPPTEFANCVTCVRLYDTRLLHRGVCARCAASLYGPEEEEQQQAEGESDE